MGSAQSIAPRSDEDDDESETDDEDGDGRRRHILPPSAISKVLEQEPEILPCYASASPLSPQPSAAGTPRNLGPAIKVWDPGHVLLPPPPLAPAAVDPTQVYLITHGECGASLRSDLVGGRWPASALTGNGERQARAVGVLINSLGVRFSSVYCSPLDRARATASLVCRGIDFAEEHIQYSDALVEMSLGEWEGCHKGDIYTPEVVNIIERTRADFLAPSGESLRQVEFRMIEFVNRTILKIPEKLNREALVHQNETKGFSRHSSANSVQDRDGSHWDMVYRFNRPGMLRKKSGKSRLQFVTTGDNDAEDDFSPRESNSPHSHETNEGNPRTCIGIFTHAAPIKCLLAALLECGPTLFDRLCIDDSSITVLQHSIRTGWQIKRLNDTAHLRFI